MKLIENFKRYFYVYIAMGLFLFFMWVSSMTPLVGDDWGYYINGLKGPLTMTFEFYQTWSGRVVGEFLGFLLASHHEWWIYFFNPLLFSSTFLLLYKIINPVRQKGLIASLILFLMFTVSHGIRMETFTFVVGSINYRFSAVMALLQLYLMGRYFKDSNATFKWYEILISIVSGMTVGLIMENIAGGLILANLLLMGYHLIQAKKVDLILLLNTVTTTGAFLMMRLSPGSRARVLEDTEWMSKNLIEKVLTKYPEFIHYTFTENTVIILILIAVMMTLIIQKRNQFKFKVTPIILSLVMLSSVYVLGSSIIVSLNESYGISFWKFTSIAYYFADMNSWILMGYWTFMAMLILGIIIYLLWKCQSIFIMCFYYLLGMAVMGAMLLSPIIGPRCAIFTVYFLIIVIGYLVNEIRFNPMVNKSATLVFSILTMLIFVWYGRLYSQVFEVRQEQEQRIEAYKQNPSGELWLPAYPTHSIHSGEAVTPYHQGVFKKFYGLDESVEIHYSWQ
ncbi:DUF6056 family protein [Turicibacter sanguinis]|uniref:DUF6056 family protein n=1 Tax=Turicibacter sanguinis TaxID=154288 RepID=UPI00189FFA4E|nr:DUF6056 family protein [Turicibacter sanguinis]MCU7201385.1 DUF6056 family protein [Turicibacter sanguinis]